MEATVAVFSPPVVDTVTALPMIALAQVLRTISATGARALVCVQTTAVSAAPMVTTLPTWPTVPVQATLEL